VADPSKYLARETLKDGSEVTVRAIRADDGARILEAFNTLDRESIYRRFFSPKKELSDAELKQLTEVDFSQVSALVVTAQKDGVETLLGGGRYAAEGGNHPRSGELAFLTARAYRGRGIASLLLRHLTFLAQEAGLSQLEADVLAENQSMLNVFRRSGLPMTRRREGNTVHVTLSLGEPSTCPSFDKSTATQRQPGT
jgi:RimJ/RimL family protein N-acetyltransferase